MIRCVVPLLVAALAFPPAGGADGPVLTGDVGAGDSYSITLKDASGAPVSHVAPGTYTLVVHDHSAIHNFHLSGPGVNVATEVAYVGDKTFTITLSAGGYDYICDAHAYDMQGSFTAGTPAAPVPKLSASVGPGARIGVRGTAWLAAGKAVIVVKDASRTDNFHLTGPGVNKATGVAFRGTVTWNVTLSAGTYAFRSDRHKNLHGSFAVAG